MFNFFDPIGINQNRTMGTFLNPVGQAKKDGTVAPFFDPIGYSGGLYRPGSQSAAMMNKINDPLNLMQRRGLL